MKKLTGKPLYTWLAALIDGEGSIMLIKKSPTVQRSAQFRPIISIANTNYALMTELKKQTGVNRIYQHRINGDPHTPRKRAQWTWRLNSQDIRIWLPRIKPYLVLKQKQANLLLEALTIKDKFPIGLSNKERWRRYSPRLFAIYGQIRNLNTTGRVVLEGEQTCTKTLAPKAV